MKSVCRAYFSTPPDADLKGDHSIFVYIMDLGGEFVELVGQAVGVEQVVDRVRWEVGGAGSGRRGKDGDVGTRGHGSI